MQLSEFQQAFNAYAEKFNQEFMIDRINTPDDNEDGSPSNVCTFKATDYLSGTIYVSAGKIGNIQTISKPIRVIDGAMTGLFNIMLIDVMTGWTIKRRNKLIRKLGYINGNFAKGGTVTEGGFRFGTVRHGDTIMFSLHTGR